MYFAVKRLRVKTSQPIKTDVYLPLWGLCQITHSDYILEMPSLLALAGLEDRKKNVKNKRSCVGNWHL